MSEANGCRRLRPLLPATASGSEAPAGASTSKAPAANARRLSSSAACTRCRRRKVKCFGERPACRQCVRMRVPCHYSTQPGETRTQALQRTYTSMQDQAETHMEVIELLRTLPDREAQVVLGKIRSGTDMTTILNYIKAGNILLQMAVAPETCFRYTFPYLSEMPVEITKDNVYLESLLYEAASLYPSDEQAKPPGLPAGLESEESRSLYLKPFHAAQVVDPQLADVRVSPWTAICDDDALMRDLLGVFFHCEYHFTAAFQKDLFLQDMAAQRKDFCSSLLVNVTLAYSCICYPRFLNRAEYWNPETLHYRFLAEAKRLWELEANEPRVTTIQAGVIFSVIHNVCGLDEVGKAYRIQAVALSHKLSLFDRTMGGPDGRIRHGRAYAAWALYIWETLTSFSFMIPPLLMRPPDWPLPDPTGEAQWYGEVWVRYPLSRGRVPMNFPQVFKARCEFRVMMNEFCQAAFSSGPGPTLHKANELRLKLRAWHEGLPALLQPRSIVLPGHLQLHMYYYHLLLALYEPLLETGGDYKPLLKTEVADQMSPHQVVSDATKNLQTLVRLYYLRHGFDSMDTYIVIPLIDIGYKCIDMMNEKNIPETTLEAVRSTLFLVATGLFSQRRNHYLAEALFRVVRGRMQPRELSLLKTTIKLEDDEPEGRLAMMQTVRSHWPVSVVKKTEDLDSHILKNLVDSYAHLNVE